MSNESKLVTMDSIPRQTCSICKQSFPLTPEFWHKNKARKCGFCIICKDCNKAKVKKWAEDNPERVQEYNKERYLKNPEIAIQRMRQWREDNPERAHQLNVDQYQKNKDHILAVNKAWTKAHPEEVKAIKQAYVERDPDKARKQKRDYTYRYPERVKLQAKEQRKKHPITGKRAKAKRRLREYQAEGTFTNEDIQRLFNEQNERCCFCGIRLFWDVPSSYHVDHYVPLNRGGSNWPENLVLACPHCNSSRQDRLVDEWMAARGW